MNSSKRPLYFSGAILLCIAATFISGLFIHHSGSTWYAGLAQPTFAPMDTVFIPVWLFCSILQGISLYLILISTDTKLALNFFIAQLFCTVLWNVFFFGLESVSTGLMVIPLLWFLTGGMITTFYKHSKIATVLNIPLFLWISFLVYINFEFWLMNAAGK